MQQINSENIKILREKTGAGWLDCKNALSKSDNDVEKAIELLRKSNVIKVEKRSGRISQCGKIFTEIDDKNAVIIEALCETDFTSKNDKFDNIIKMVSYDCLKNCNSYENITSYINQNHKDKIMSLSVLTGENIKIDRAIRWSGNCASYVHLGNIGVLISYELDDTIKKNDAVVETKLNEICMHIAAFNPKYLSPQDIPNSLIESEKRIYLEQLNTNKKIKSQDMIENILTNKIKKWCCEICLLEQPWIKDDKITTEKAIVGIKINKFIRWQIGSSE